VSRQKSILNCRFARTRIHCALAVGSCIALLGCGTLEVNRLTDRLIASNERDWSPQFRVLPKAVIAGDQITLYNIRNSLYLSEKDFIVQHYDKLFSLRDIQTVDFIIVPFQGMESIAHTMLSFGLADGTYLAVSVEVRTEKGESYTTALGLSHEFELAYVVADERDLIRLRTRHRDAEVYLYPSRATPQQAQDLFVDVMQRANQLAEKPEFYDTISNNAPITVRHVNRVMPNKIPSAWQVLLSGHSDRYAYDLGLFDQRIPFEELKELRIPMTWPKQTTMPGLFAEDPLADQTARGAHSRYPNRHRASQGPRIFHSRHFAGRRFSARPALGRISRLVTESRPSAHHPPPAAQRRRSSRSRRTLDRGIVAP
jgi:hypothetical protein